MKKNQGLIKWIIIIIVALILLGYYGIDIKKVLRAPSAQSNLNFAEQTVSTVWNNYLKGPAIYVWNQVFIKYISK